MNPLLLMTGNQGKIIEFRSLMRETSIPLLSSKQLGIPIPPETGKTFEENATIKAKEGMDRGYLTLADDSGFCVEILDNRPGIYSARWADKYGGWKQAAQHIYQELETKKSTNKDAHFVCVLALAIPWEKRVLLFRGTTKGTFLWPPQGKGGFGYDAYFIPKKFQKTFAEMSEKEKSSLSHRTKAFHLLEKTLKTQIQNIKYTSNLVDAQKDFPVRYGDWEVKGIVTDF